MAQGEKAIAFPEGMGGSDVTTWEDFVPGTVKMVKPTGERVFYQ
jgi:hypothetical protein